MSRRAMEEIRTILAQKNLDHDRQVWTEQMRRIRPEDVQKELSKPAGKYSFPRLLTLLSPAAEECLEEMAQQAARLTIQRFGRTIQLYAPLYVSNVCINSCRYCGYNRHTVFERTRLSIEEALADAAVIAEEGFRHLLLVSGEDRAFVTTAYLAELAARLRRRFSSLSVEIYPMTQEEYRILFEAGIDGVTLYQETYDREAYAYYHPAGPKRDYDWRLLAPDRFASAGMRRIGLGVLLGLTDWRLETLALAEHAAYLMKRYWRSQVAFSFPRLRPALGAPSDWPHLLSDRNLVQMMLALRLCFADAGIVLSTRERAQLRDHLVDLCVTSMSAGSKTNPGGYTGHEDTAEQFVVADSRTPAQIAQMIRSKGKDPVWKDWDAAFAFS
ncbi:MAG: 2-iminoacetate synthase ThiH [Anaerohalosphaeraceae bacterium]